MANQQDWIPRSVYEEAAGCVWLPRLIDKARRTLEGEQQGKDLVHPYMYGDGDYMDAKLLQFLGITGGEVLDILRNEPDDTAAANRILERSKRTQEECAAWSRTFRRQEGLFLAMIEADDGRRPPGLGTSFLRAAYNAFVLPLGIWMYRRHLQSRK